MKKPNPRSGSNFDDFLKEEELYDAVTAKALKRMISEQLKEGMVSNRITKMTMAARMEAPHRDEDNVIILSNQRVLSIENSQIMEFLWT